MEIALDFSNFDLATLMESELFFTGLVAFALVFLFFFLLFFSRYLVRKYERFHISAKMKVLQIMVPKDLGGDKSGEAPGLQQIQEKIGVAETLFSTLAGLKAEKGLKTWWTGPRELFSFELIAHKGKIEFFVAVPEHLQSYMEEQIQAQFPKSFIEEVPDYNIFTPKSIIGGKYLTFGKEYIFPIKTYKKFEADPLNSIINAMSKIEEADGAAVQLVFRSEPKKWHNFGASVASKMQQGKKLNDALKDVKGGFLHALGKIFSKPKKDGEMPKEYRLSPMEEEVAKGLEEKTSKAGVAANIRIVVASEKQMNIDKYLNNITNAYTQYNVYKYGNGFSVQGKDLKKIMKDFIYRHVNENEKMIMNTEELASLYHFPITLVNETPNIHWLESKKSPAPLNIPSEGILLGKNFYRGRETIIRMGREERRRHMYIIGQTGTGKSYFASYLAMQDINNGEGMCFIDPHGDDLEEILAHVPKERAEDVIIVDPADTSRPIGLNMLEYDDPDQMTFVVNEVMSIFDKLYDLKSTGGPIFEQYFKNACYLVMSDPETGSTLMEIPRVLADDEFRELKLSRCKSQVVKDFWEKEALKAGGEASLQNMVPYITSKLAPFIANDIMRPIISQQTSSINFKEAMDNKKIVLVKLSKGKLGKINADLLGMIVITKILMAALSRADLPPEKRLDFYLYIDEFQNFLTDSIEIILSEARKYKLCLIVGHQYIGQLVKNNDTKFKDAIFGNVGTKVAFRIGVDDAEAMAKEYSPVFSEYDFLNVPAYNNFVKLLVNNANPPSFNMACFRREELPIAPKNTELALAIKELSKLKYGKERELIEMEVADRIKKFS